MQRYDFFLIYANLSAFLCRFFYPLQRYYIFPHFVGGLYQPYHFYPWLLRFLSKKTPDGEKPLKEKGVSSNSSSEPPVKGALRIVLRNPQKKNERGVPFRGTPRSFERNAPLFWGARRTSNFQVSNTRPFSGRVRVQKSEPKVQSSKTPTALAPRTRAT